VLKNDQPLILFDGVCNLCNSTVQFVIKRDQMKQFHFASLQGETGQELLKKYNLFEEDMNSFLLLEGNHLYTRSTAALRVLKKMNGGWQLLYAFIIVPEFIRNSVYNWIARNRYKWFGKRNECMVPLPELKERFLD